MLRFIFLLIVFPFNFNYAQEYYLELIADGFNSVVEMTHAGDQRIFVVEQTGKIKILNHDGDVNPQPFLDLSSLVSTGGERGLLGLAFPPDYNETGRFYVNYTNQSGNTVVARYLVSNNPDIAETEGTVILSYNQPYTNHNGGSLHFGDDGYLWISSGDGGGGGDPDGNGQNTETFLGKLLRIDVSGSGYSIPPDNPFAQSGGKPEIWAYGLRNPWKFSFDNVTGEILIADVGQNMWEEINRQPVNLPGLNYGWRCYEGNVPYNTNGCGSADDMTFPVAVYQHTNGRCSITGGYVYRGNEFQSMFGKYFFGDYCSGEIGVMDQENNIEFILNTGINITSFGEDSSGELYVLGSGKIYKIGSEILRTTDLDKSKIRIYPNPVRDILNLETTSPIDNILFFSMDGKLKKEFKTAEKKINISDFSPGIYIIKVFARDSVQTFKINKE